MRSRNLQWGIQRVVVDVLGTSETEAKSLASKVTHAARLLPQSDDQTAGVGRLVRGLWQKLTNPLVTWIDPSTLDGRLTKAGVQGITRTNKRKLTESFTDLDSYLRKRFALHARLWSIFWAAFIAFYFQLSTPLLLNQLATDTELRDDLVAEAETLAGQADAIQQRVPSYGDVGPEALTTIMGRHPKLASRLRHAAGVGGTREYLLRELDYVLADVPEQRDAIAKEYGELLDQLHQEAAQTALEQVSDMTSRLAKFDVKPWKHGWAFYQNSSNLFGILITAILLSFGAPFWFEWLGRLLKLRDVLSPGDKVKEPQESNETQPDDE